MKKYIAVLLSLLSSLAFAQESFVKKDFNVAVNVKLICIEDYDSDGNCVHRISANGVECWYEYDSHGNWIHKKSNVSGNSSDESLCEYEYDDKGNKLHSKSSGADGDFEEWFEYDSENRMTRNRNSYGIDNYYEYIFNGDIILTRQNNEVVSIHENDSDGKHSYTRSSRGTTSISETDDDGNLIYYSNSLGYKNGISMTQAEI